MEETKKCKYCQSDIDKKAKVCPNCRRKQGGKGKFIIIGIIVLFVFVGALNRKDEVKNSGNNKTTEVNSNADGKNDDATKKDTKDTKGSSEDTEKLIKLGSYGQSDDLVLKVNKIGETDEITENDFLSYKPDSGKYAIININIKNSGKKSISLTNGYFKLISKDGAEYEPSILLGLDNKYITFESINPGLDVTGNLVFEVPTDFVVTDATLKFSGTGLFSSAINFSLK